MQKPSFPCVSLPDSRALSARLIGIAVLLLSLSPTAQSEIYQVYFDNGAAGRLAIGELHLDALGEDNGYRFELDDALFSDHFLSMRPFKCVAHLERMFCYLGYPYAIRRNISRQDLTDLEYDLLFIARRPTEYGIDPWNGRYFRLRWEGDSIVGTIHETDLDILASPPEDGGLRPLAAAEIVPMEASDAQWTPRIVIEPR